MVLTKSSIGQDSHRFLPDNTDKPLILGGVLFEGCPGMEANSDGDVVLHAITNCISGITGVNVLGSIADSLCVSGIKDSAAYLQEALKYLSEGYKIEHISLTIEGLRPKFAPKINEMKRSIGALLKISPDWVGITATTGEGLTPFGQGLGLSVFGILTVSFEK